MRINIANKSIDIEPRDINFIVDAYAANYYFFSKGQIPQAITLPMYAKAHTRYGDIPIAFVPDVDSVAVEIIEDGKSIPEATPEPVAELPKPAIKVEAKPDRAPRQPPGPIIPPGSGGLSLPARDPSDLRHTMQDLAPEREIDESKEREVNISKAEDGSKRIG